MDAKRAMRACLLVLAVLVSACHKPAGQAAAGARGAEASGPVMTSFYPLTYFARRIAGDFLEIVCPVPDDADPSLWQPGAGDIRLMQSASLIFVNGASYEHWLATAPLPRSRVVDTSSGFRADYLRYAHAITHSHGPAGAHSHEGTDGHTWIDPVQALAQARAVRDALVRTWPGRQADFDRGFASLAADLKRLDERLTAVSPSLAAATLIATHPAYNYPARRYGWTVTDVVMDPAAPLTDADAARFAAATKGRTGRPVILWESEPAAATRSALSQRLGATSVLFDPCETPGTGGDYLQRMNENIDRLEAAVSDAPG